MVAVAGTKVIKEDPDVIAVAYLISVEESAITCSLACCVGFELAGECYVVELVEVRVLILAVFVCCAFRGRCVTGYKGPIQCTPVLARGEA